jgi:hypothetical protein
MYWGHVSTIIPLGNNFVIIYCSGIGVSLSIITWLVGYGFLISARKSVKTITLKYVISISAAIAFIFGTTFSLIFEIVSMINCYQQQEGLENVIYNAYPILDAKA